ncbi:hypothetical protein CI238_02978, partial [Colletotrichum incanum]
LNPGMFLRLCNSRANTETNLPHDLRFYVLSEILYRSDSRCTPICILRTISSAKTSWSPSRSATPRASCSSLLAGATTQRTRSASVSAARARDAPRQTGPRRKRSVRSARTG